MHYTNNMRDKLLSLAVALVLAASAFGQQPTAPHAPAVTSPSQPRQATAGESAPDTKRLRRHVEYLASDKLEGRRTGTRAAEEAASYIAGELANYKIKVAPPTPSGHVQGITDMGYLRTFPYVAGVEAGKGNAMTFASRAAADATTATLDLRLGEDWMPLGWSANGRAENLPVVFVGYGITASEQNHDDYAGMDVNGRIVLALAGTPDSDNPHGQLTRFGEPRLKAATARERGARALVLVAREDNFRDDSLARLRYDNAGGDAGLPVVAVSRAVARRMLEAGGIAPSLDRLEKAQQPSQASSSPRQAVPPSTSAASSPARQNFSAALQGIALDIAVDLARRRVPAFNVVGILEGADPKLKNEYVVVGAHYDHLGRGGAGSLAAREGDIHHGADDNASGVAGLLELARLLSEERARVRRSVVFVAFGGEEEGLLGSNHYVNHPVVPLAQTVAMINLDMIGRLRNEKLFIGGVGTAREWRAWIAGASGDPNLKVGAGARDDAGRAASAREGSAAVGSGAQGQATATNNRRTRFTLALDEDGFGPSDHSSFYGRKIPVLFFFTGTHEDYHKPTDTAERLNYEGHARIVGFIGDILRSIDASDAPPAYAVARSGESAGRSQMGFRVYLGTVPNYARSETGMKLDAVREDSPALRAGLRAGDVIVKLAGRDVRNVYDYTHALSEMRAGQEYDVEILRDGKPLSFRITPASRR